MHSLSKIDVVNRTGWMARLGRDADGLCAMYSSSAGCITTDPAAMLVPVDDHLVHRGDGAFESLKCVEGHIHHLVAHLERLQQSCAAIGLQLPVSHEELASIVVQTVRAGDERNALVRMLVSRGSGTMGVNPYDCHGEVLYVVVYRSNQQGGETAFPAGARAAISTFPVKPGLFARVKTCNYLPNVLMKKEALDQGVDFTVSVDEAGNLGEGATENFGIVTAEGALLTPPPERVLAGTTAKRVLLLAQKLVSTGLLQRAAYELVPMEAVFGAAEMHAYGTMRNVTPVVELNGRPVGSGNPGPVAHRLFDLMKAAMVPKNHLLTQVFD